MADAKLSELNELTGTPANDDEFLIADTSEVESKRITYATLKTAIDTDTNANSFETVACPAGTNPVADSSTDTLTLASGGANLTITGDSGTDTVTFAVVDAQIDHDATTNFVANEHVDHSTVSITTSATSGLSGGGDLTATRSPVVAPDQANAGTVASLDEILAADVDNADALIKVTAQSIANLADHDALTNFDAAEHFTEASIDHTNITNVGTNTHAQIDTHIADTSDPHGATMTQTNLTVSGELVIPTSATPTVATEAELVIDSSVADWSHGILEYYSGEAMAVVAMPVAELTTPSGGSVPTYNAATDEFELVVPSGTGDVVGPGSSTDNAIARFDGALGKTVQNSGATVDDSGNITTPIVFTQRVVDITIENPTNSEAIRLFQVPSHLTSITITKVVAHTDVATSTVDYNIEERAAATPNVAGTDLLAADAQADLDGLTSTSFSNASFAVSTHAYLTTSATANSPTALMLQITYDEVE